MGGTTATHEAAWLTEMLRMSSVTSRPSMLMRVPSEVQVTDRSVCRAVSSMAWESSGQTPFWIIWNPRARYMAPVSR